MSLIVDIKKQLGSFTLDVAFEAEDGITSLLGASGCGKSMTLKCVAGIERPDSGHIELDGVTLFDSGRGINLSPQKRQVGYLFQNYALFPNMTVRQNLLCGLNREKNRGVKDERLKDMLRLMQLEGLADHKPSQLSGGQQQRVALGRILLSDPRLLLLDEPFSALDGHLRDALKLKLRDLLQSFGHEVLMVTHDRTEAYNMSREIAVMDQGRILAKKPTKLLFADPGSVPAAVLTGCKNIAAAHRVDAHTVEVPAWGIRLETAQEVRDGLSAVGIRAHYFNPSAPSNRFPVSYVEEMEEPFETTIQFRFINQDPASEAIWWRLTKDKRPSAFTKELGVSPANILLLY